MKLVLNSYSFVFDREIVKLLLEIEEFKGSWKAYGNLAPERLIELKRIATIESIGSSTRIKAQNFQTQKLSESWRVCLSSHFERGTSRKSLAMRS